MNDIIKNVAFEHKLSGKYRLEKFKVGTDGNEIRGTRIQLTDWFSNHIVNGGLNSIATVNATIDSLDKSCLASARVGAGTTAPTDTDTALVAKLATTSTKQAVTYGLNAATPYYGWTRITFRFALGAVVGNVSEVAIYTNQGNMFSRALITDGLGTPISITVLSDEQLDVIYELRNYASEATVSYGPVTISGVDYSGDIKSSAVTNNNYYGWVYSLSQAGSGLSGSIIATSNMGGCSAYATQTLGSITALPSGTAYPMTSRTVIGSYVTDSFYVNHEVLWDLNQGNTGSGIGSISVTTLLGTYQFSLTPKIMKDNTKRLKLNIRVSWGRYTP